MANFANAFITGASSGLGHGLARQLAKQGTCVVAAARREPELRALVDDIRRQGGRAEVCVLDVTDPQAVTQAVQHWDATTGGLDLVIANAGVGLAREGDKLTWQDVETTLRVNVLGSFATLVAAIDPMVRRGRGTLVGISSLAALRGLPHSGAYSASKAALSTFLETLRIDLGPKGLQVVDVRPGFIETDMTRANHFPMPFMISVEQAAKTTLAGIEQGSAVVAFPWTLAQTMAVAERMPEPMWRRIARRFPV